MKATLYPCPESKSDREAMIHDVDTRLTDLSNILAQSKALRKSLIDEAAKNLAVWHCKVKKSKSIFHTMNMFNFDQRRAIAECWVPTCYLPEVRNALESETVRHNFDSILLIENLYLISCTFLIESEQFEHANNNKHNTHQAKATHLQSIEQVHRRLPEHR